MSATKNLTPEYLEGRTVQVYRRDGSEWFIGEVLKLDGPVATIRDEDDGAEQEVNGEKNKIEPID